jgi:hypothetical protein
VDSLTTSVVTGLNVLAAAVSTMDATREPPVYKTMMKNQRRFRFMIMLTTNYDPIEALKPTKTAIDLFMPLTKHVAYLCGFRNGAVYNSI